MPEITRSIIVPSTAEELTSRLNNQGELLKVSVFAERPETNQSAEVPNSERIAEEVNDLRAYQIGVTSIDDVAKDREKVISGTSKVKWSIHPPQPNSHIPL